MQKAKKDGDMDLMGEVIGRSPDPLMTLPAAHFHGILLPMFSEREKCRLEQDKWHWILMEDEWRERK